MIRVGDTVWIVHRVDIPNPPPSIMTLTEKGGMYYVYFGSEAECQRHCDELMQELKTPGIVYKPHPVRLVGVQQERFL